LFTVFWALVTICLLFACSHPAPSDENIPVTISFNENSPQLLFAVQDLKKALQERKYPVRLEPVSGENSGTHPVRIVLSTLQEMASMPVLFDLPSGLRPEGFSIRIPPGTGHTRKGQSISGEGPRKGQSTFWVVGADDAGAMYGGLELAEMIRISGLDGIEEQDRNPYMEMRGVKFNCPLDVRTPSYSDVSDSAQNNIEVVWDFDFWREYIDNLAKHRFNFVSLWNLHPFPSLVKLEDYPDIALDDVQRSTVDWQEHYQLEGIGFDAPDILNNVEVIKKMTIDEKINFWRKVMQYGKERNVDFYIVTWNIFVNGTGGKYGITDSIQNETTRDYFRQSVKQLFLTYPDLKGIGLTTGENMRGASTLEKEDWAFQTYARGVSDAAAEEPGRKITFIHRQHQAGALDIAKKFQPLVDHPNIDFVFSFKYAKAHVYSSTVQTFHPEFVEDIQSSGDLSTIWTLRNDDIYQFRWGAPDFVREFISKIPYEVSRGYYYGSDQYIWGREFLSLNPESPRQLEIAKHWYQWMLWGRLGYDPEITNERFIGILENRFPEVSGQMLFTAWQAASMIYPLTTGFHWGALDFQWYIEACLSRPEPAQTESGFHDVNRFITLGPHPGTDNISIPDYVEAISKGEKLTGTSPQEVSEKIHVNSDQALKMIEGMDDGGNAELKAVLDDIRSMAWLGKYYAHKIRGAAELALFRENGIGTHREAAVRELESAAGFWEKYTDSARASYRNPFWTNRVGYVDWDELTREVRKDIGIARGSVQ
jgi:hypothetical protein